MSTTRASEVAQMTELGQDRHYIEATQYTCAQLQDFALATDDAYPLRDVRIHQLVRPAYFSRSSHVALRGQTTLWRVLRVKKVLVPAAAAGALDDERPDYVRLGLPARLVRGLFRDHDRRKDRLDDPLYDAAAAADADIWWVRAWPTVDAVAPFAGAGGGPAAAALLRDTGHGFEATVDLVFDFFFAAERPDNDQGPLQPAHVRRANRRLHPLRTRAQGPVVTVVRCVLTGQHDGRPEPVRRAGVDEAAEYGCHLPTYWDDVPVSVMEARGRLGTASTLSTLTTTTTDSWDKDVEEAERESLQLPPILSPSPLLTPVEAVYGALVLEDAAAVARAAAAAAAEGRVEGRSENGRLLPDAARAVAARPVVVPENSHVVVDEHVMM